MEILHRDIAQEILPRGLLHKSSSQESSCRELVQRFHKEILPRDLLQRSCTETLHRDLLQRSCQEVPYINLAKRAYRELVQRSCQETSYRELVQRFCQETSFRDLFRHLAKMFLTEILPEDLLWRSCTDLVKRAEILLRDPLQRA